MKNKLMWLISMLFIALTCICIYQNTVGMANLQKYGVTVKSLVCGSSYAKGTYTYDIKLIYNTKIYENSFRTSKRTFNINDSVLVKINSQNPDGYCILVGN
ncbi:hypothetical protein [Hymenobacter sp. BRD67]|uniref:hypothetical protein n=1 Tax=Hymenobacter sp. BRD67 TaxID=2675877 RepID=UPI0015640761|nr:hypothetical protein [Hymenobacter sp. BRD67]QKG51964.1 hypothetical protein GKZ67_04240 [Hymenobacter sp. BRD67]